MDWPDWKTLTKVQGFLGICGIIRIWVKYFAKHAKPLVLLIKKMWIVLGAWIRRCLWRI